MAIQILSDLHLEAPKAYDTYEIVPKAPYLALLGDISNIVLHKDDCLHFLTRQLNQFRAVLFVPGNHDAYGSNWPDALRILRTFEHDIRKETFLGDKDTSLGEFVLLDRADFQPPGTNITILGCSLFSYVPVERHLAVGFGLKDFLQISDWDVYMHNVAHRRDVAWLNARVADLEKQSDIKIMILSHWSPSNDIRAIDPRYTESRIISGFSTDLSEEACFKSSKVKVWAFGHTHYNCDFVVDRAGASPLRLLTNQKGYHFTPAEGYDGEKTVEL